MSMNLNQVVDVTVRSSEAPASQYKTYILKPNIVSDVNTLTQAMLDVAGANTKFVIKYDYTLGENITVPTNCILEFDGGSISASGSNDTITGTNTGINAGLVKIFNPNVILTGSFNISCWYVEWFGAVGDNVSFIDGASIQAAIDAANKTYNKKVVLLEKKYHIDSAINLYSRCELTGAVSKDTRDNKPIIQAVNCDAIHIVRSTDQAKVYNVSLSNIDIRGNKASGFNGTDGNEYNGITIGDASYSTSEHINISNVSVQGTNKGVYIKGDAGNALWDINVNKCVLTRNTIGYYVDGNVSSHQHKAWFNCNKITNCHIRSNTTGGVYLENVGSLLNFIVDSCAFEGNGENYNDNVHVFGIKVRNTDTYANGGNIISNCYFENNIPEKHDGEPSANEYTYNGCIYPNGWTEDVECGAIVIFRRSFIIRDNIFQNYYGAVKILHDSDIIADGNTFIAEKQFFATQKYTPAFVLCATSAGSLKSSNNIFKLDTVNTRHSFVEYTDGGYYTPSAVEDAMRQYIIVDEGNFSYKGGRLTEGEFIVNGSSDCASPVLGLTNYTSIDNLAHLYQTINGGGYTEGDVINVRIDGETTSGYSESQGNVDNIYPSINMYAGDNGSIQLGSTGRFVIKSDMVINDITFIANHNSGSGANLFLVYPKYANKVVFNRCVFKQFDSLITFFSDKSNTLGDVCEIVFNECDFSLGMNYMKLIDSAQVATGIKFLVNNCTGIKQNNSLRFNVPYKTLGEFADRQTLPNDGYLITGYGAGFSYFDTTNNRMIYWTGSAWVDATGATV